MVHGAGQGIVAFGQECWREAGKCRGAQETLQTTMVVFAFAMIMALSVRHRHPLAWMIKLLTRKAEDDDRRLRQEMVRRPRYSGFEKRRTKAVRWKNGAKAISGASSSRVTCSSMEMTDDT